MDMMSVLLNESPRRGDTRGTNGARYGYGSSYRSPQQSPRDPRPEPRGVYEFDSVLVNTREDAQEVLNKLNDLIQDYGNARVADLYATVGMSPRGFTDEDWGWRDLRGATFRATREGYLIVLPDAISLRR